MSVHKLESGKPAVLRERTKNNQAEGGRRALVFVDISYFYIAMIKNITKEIGLICTFSRGIKVHHLHDGEAWWQVYIVMGGAS